MPNNSRLTMTHDPILINSISRYVYDAIVTIHQHHPQWLNDKFRNYPWQNPDFKLNFLAKFGEKLSQTTDRDELVKKLLKILESFLAPSFFVSNQFSELIIQVRKYTHPFLDIESHNLENGKGKAAFVVNNSKAVDGAIAILLLDAENLQLELQKEKFLSGICTYPIQIKVAFANWRTMGKKDAELQARGYELIHVPPGKDSADLKMATVGSSIFVHYPNAKEVLVCSSDKVMTHLCTTLQTHGLTVYLVRQEKGNLVVLNNKTGETKNYSLVFTSKIPSLEEFISQIDKIIKQEQKITGKEWIQLTKISQLFQREYKIRISQVISTYLPGKKVKDFFLAYSDKFVIHKHPKKSQVYVTTFDFGKNEIIDKNHSNENNSIKPEAKILSPINSQVDLEEALVNIIQALTAEGKENYVPIAEVASEFHKQYAQPITKTIQSFKLGKNFSKFLQNSGKFQIKKIKNLHQVAPVVNSR
ncbi:MAG: NYN domain-containing protein [Moorea sp. SIO2B7]|nr:NYN domain-containing protein [Moorena sp. SIO2B7]